MVFGLFFPWGEVDPVDLFENRGAVLEPPGSKVMVLINFYFQGTAVRVPET